MFPQEDKESLEKELVFAVVWLMWPKKWEDGRSNDGNFEPTGLVFIVPHRHDKPKQSPCLLYQSTKNHAKINDLRIINDQEMMAIQEVTWRG